MDSPTILLLIPRSNSVWAAASGGLVRLGLQDPRDQHQHRQSPQQHRMDAALPCHYYLLCFPSHVILDCFDTHLCMLIVILCICTCTCHSGRLRLYTNSYICIPRFGTRYGHRPRPPRFAPPGLLEAREAEKPVGTAGSSVAGRPHFGYQNRLFSGPPWSGSQESRVEVEFLHVSFFKTHLLFHTYHMSYCLCPLLAFIVP